VEGPASRGIIRNLRGITGDDVVALNAWDWKHYSITFGPIKNILVDGVAGAPQNGHNAIRLLAGTKNFANGIHVDCDICNIIVRNIFTKSIDLKYMTSLIWSWVGRKILRNL